MKTSEAKTLIGKRILIDDCGSLVERVVTGTFGGMYKRGGCAGLTFSDPLSDGCRGVSFQFIKSIN